MFVLRHIPSRPTSPVALTIGNFDGVHVGHEAMIARVIERARQAQLASCVMTFEPHPREFFAPNDAPTRLTSLREKLERFAVLGVDHVLVCRFDRAFAQITAGDFIERILVGALDARYVLVGDDFRFGARRAGDFQMLRSASSQFGFELERMDSVEIDGVRVSSTLIRQQLAEGDLRGAAQLLGRPYSISGRVVRGDGIGRRLGFPTANVAMHHNRAPLMGIFAAELVGIDSAPLPGAASLGVRPTVKGQGAAPVLEIHLFDFDRDIYGRRVQVRFLHKLRDEEKYSDLRALAAAIADDVADARAYFGLDHRSGLRTASRGPSTTSKARFNRV
ncbi:MAG TPA: bifunctional riboflavin kinase/FAD synthetase [Burkholderiales bacterium]|nr:bifunctional riboflavin kinase/FAD synthetase [Burkholderiales bacterium]